jgi:TPR repeat protein
MKTVFISYSSEDYNKVSTEIIPDIECINGIECWFDNTAIESGSKFPKKISEGIEKCHIFLFMLSESSMRKPWPKKELKQAEELQILDPTRKVILVNIDDSKRIGVFKRKYKDTDIINWNETRKHEKLISDIDRWTREKAESYFREGINLENSSNPEDQKEAFRLFHNAAEMGLAKSQSKVAYYLKTGKNNIVEKNLGEALKWCGKAYKQGDSGAFSLMGQISREIGDRAGFIRYHKEAADSGWAFSQYQIGNAYYTRNISGDIFDAIYWLKKASDQNQPDAQKLLGEILLKHFKKGHKVLAIKYLTKAQNGFHDKIENPDGDGVKNHAQDAIKKIEDLCKDYDIKL